MPLYLPALLACRLNELLDADERPISTFASRIGVKTADLRVWLQKPSGFSALTLRQLEIAASYFDVSLRGLFVEETIGDETGFLTREPTPGATKH